MNREELLKEKCPDCGATSESGDWYEKNASQDWGALGVGPRYHCRNCDCFRVIVPFDPSEEMTVRRDSFRRAMKILATVVEGDGSNLAVADLTEIREILAGTESFAGHAPARGSEVEAYIKDWRDDANENSSSQECRVYFGLMLDDYRERADTGKGLLESDEGE